MKEGCGHLLSAIEITEKSTRRYRFQTSQAAVDRLARILGWNAPKQHKVEHTQSDFTQMSDVELDLVDKQRNLSWLLENPDRARGSKAQLEAELQAIEAKLRAVRERAI